jgi:hypothetical protein
MASTKGKLKAVGFFLSGFLAGAILVVGLVAWRFSILYRDWYYLQILDEANTAFMIRAGREEELVKNIETTIPQCIVAADSIWGSTEARLDSFWYVKRYYERFDINVPAEIQPILDKLPPRPLTSCEIRQSIQTETEPNKMEPNNPPPK